MTSFTVNSDMDVTRTDIAERIGTTAGELDELRHNGVFVLLCKSSMFDTINTKACDIVGKPGQVRGPAFMVRHTSPTMSLFDSCAPEDVMRAFPNIIQRPVIVVSATMQVDKHEVQVIEAPPQADEEIRVIIAQAVEKYKQVDQRIVIDDEEDENFLAGKRGLPVRRGKTSKTLRRNRKREKEQEEEEEEAVGQPPVRRSSRLKNKRR
jgi:hypothetical protein